MSGLFMLMLAIIWFVVAVLLSRWVGRMFRRPSARTIAAFAAFVVLLPLPVADELIGMWQFNALCKSSSMLRIDPAVAKGKTVRLVIKPRNAILPGQILTTYYSHMSYRDTGTEEEVASFSHYVVKGGWLVHALGIFGSNVPLVIGKPSCRPENVGTLPARFGFTLVD